MFAGAILVDGTYIRRSRDGYITRIEPGGTRIRYHEDVGMEATLTHLLDEAFQMQPLK